MSKSKFRESLEALSAEQAARVIPEMKEWLANVEEATNAPDYSSMTDQELHNETYRIEREARVKANG